MVLAAIGNLTIGGVQELSVPGAAGTRPAERPDRRQRFREVELPGRLRIAREGVQRSANLLPCRAGGRRRPPVRPDGANLAAFLYLLQVRHKSAYVQIRRTVQLAAPFFDDFVLAPRALNPDTIQLEWRHRRSEAHFGASVDTQVIVATQSPLLLDYFEPEEVLVAERKGKETKLRRLEAAPLSVWLEDYSLGQLWEKNELGGRPGSEWWRDCCFTWRARPKRTSLTNSSGAPAAPQAGRGCRTPDAGKMPAFPGFECAKSSCRTSSWAGVT